MKKTLAIILSISMMFSLLGVIGNAAEEKPQVSFAVASDLHYTEGENPLVWYSEDPIFGYANRRAAMDNESSLIIDEFLNQCAENDDIQFVLISGDLTDEGKSLIEDHYAVAEKFRKFEEETGKQIYVINGNHDVGIKGEYCTTGLEEFKEIYFEFGWDEAISVMEDNCSYTADLGDDYRLIALDSCDPDKSTEDGMTKEKVNWVIDQAAIAKEDGRHPILMMHHNLLDHLPLQRILSRNFIIRNHLTTAEKWANAGIKLVFTGHEHCSDATSYTSTSGNIISDFATTALSMYPLQYRYIEMYEDEITYEAKTIEKIDTDALLASFEGYTDAHVEAMNAGLNAYAKQFLKNGVEYRLERGFNNEQLGIKPSDLYYPIIRGAVDGLNDILNMPLYGENSAQELGREYGIEIPDSDYKDGWDVATELVSAHYAGSEDYPLSDRDVTILLRTVSIILKTELSMVTDNEFIGAAAFLMATFGIDASIIDQLAQQQGGVSAGEYFLLALASPILQSFANDDFVDDNNGKIDGYGKTETTDNLINIGNNLGQIITDLIKYLKLIFTFLDKGFNVL